MRLKTSGSSPESSGARSTRIRKTPISTPDTVARTTPRSLGRTAPFSGTNPTSTTATSAMPRAM